MWLAPWPQLPHPNRTVCFSVRNQEQTSAKLRAKGSKRMAALGRHRSPIKMGPASPHFMDEQTERLREGFKVTQPVQSVPAGIQRQV